MGQTFALSATYDSQEEQTTVLQRATTLVALHFKTEDFSGYVEADWLMLGKKDTPTRQESVAFGVHADYAADRQADGTGWGILGNWGTGDEDYEQNMQESWRVAAGPYWVLHPSLRNSLLVYIYGGLEEVPNSDGYWVAWNWEAKF
jgi:hypothetical protein